MYMYIKDAFMSIHIEHYLVTHSSPVSPLSKKFQNIRSKSLSTPKVLPDIKASQIKNYVIPTKTTFSLHSISKPQTIPQ